MKYSELSNESIKQILIHLQYLVDGNFNHTGDIMKTHSEDLQGTNPLEILKQFLNPSTQSNTVGSTTDLLKLVLNELVKINAVFDKLLNEEKA